MAVSCLIRNFSKVLTVVATGGFWVECVPRVWVLMVRNGDGQGD